MEEDTKELSAGEQEVVRRLNAIRDSKKVRDFIQDVKEDAENSGIAVKFKSRIKENASALNKFRKYIEQSGIEDPEMWDSCGMMLIVDDEEDIYKFVEYMEEKLTTREDGLSDYVKNPKAGYRSVHMYSTFAADGITVPSEIQIKTEAMSIAQDVTHDSIYKQEGLSWDTINQLTTVICPIAEKMADADKFEGRGQLEEAEELRKEAEQIRIDNAELLSEHQETVDSVWREYGKIVFTHHNIDEIEGALFLSNPDLSKEGKAKVDRQLQGLLDDLFDHYKENANDEIDVPRVSGNKEVDYAIYILGQMDYGQFVEEVKSMQKAEKDNKDKNKSKDSKEHTAEECQEFASTRESKKVEQELMEAMRNDREQSIEDIQQSNGEER